MKTNDPKKLALLESLKSGLIVSCQTQKDELFIQKIWL